MTKKLPVIFTDLDGTLLDNTTYSFEPALPALKIIRSQKIPLVICTSKTGTEIRHIRKKFTNSDPFISENGGGIFIPEHYFLSSFDYHREIPGVNIIELGASYEILTAALIRIKNATGLPLKGFSMMNPQEIAVLCNFSSDEARMAKQRDYDEPFIFSAHIEDALSANEQLQRAVERENLLLTRGGRFYHLTGQNDKGKAVRILIELFIKDKGNIVSIALGDSLNDLPMLREADVAVLIQKENGSYENVTDIEHIRSNAPGPQGWNNTVMGLLEKFL